MRESEVAKLGMSEREVAKLVVDVIRLRAEPLVTKCKSFGARGDEKVRILHSKG